MATYTKFNQFVEDMAGGVHDFQTGTTDVFKVMLTLTAPVATNSVRANLTEIASGDGYTTGGNQASFTTGVETSGTFKLVLADPAQWVASAGTFADFRYAVLYNDTPTSPADPLIGFWDYGSTISLGSSETFDVDLSAANGVFTFT